MIHRHDANVAVPVTRVPRCADAFCWWRWAEYSVSASIMAMAIAISIGIRDDNTLASIWMLHFTTMCFGFLVPLAAPRLG